MGGLTVDHAVSVACGCAAVQTNGSKLDYFIGKAKKSWHWAEGLSSEILIQTRHNNFDSIVGEPNCKLDDPIIEELNLLNDQHIEPRVEVGFEVHRIKHGNRFMANTHMSDHHVLVVTTVNRRLKDLHVFLRIKSATRAANEFFGLSREHAAANYGDGSQSLHIAS